MRKTNRNLQLSTLTIKRLDDSRLEEARGGTSAVVSSKMAKPVDCSEGFREALENMTMANCTA